MAQKKIEVLQKLLAADRFHPSFKVIGALSGRMSGADGLNPQGIDKTKEVRGCFPLAFDGEVLLGGDMQSFEISIAAADYDDPKLTKNLLTCERCNTTVRIDERGRKLCDKCVERQMGCSTPRCETCELPLDVRVSVVKGKEKVETWCYRCQGAETKSFHALFAMGFWPHMTYEEIMATKGTSNPIYNYAKNAAFATLYGAQAAKIAATLGLDVDTAQEGFLRFWRTYEVAGRKRRSVEARFATLYSNDTSGKIFRKQADDSIESLLGFRRFFTLENYLIGCLFELANDPPASWLKHKTKIIRSKRGEQTVGNALRSALYGAAFATQNGIIRQAANHRIQSTGAGITKATQVAIWGIQPSGVSPWRVRPMNIHDEIQCPTHPDYVDEVTRVVYAAVEKFRPLVPLIGIDFGRLNSWADK
jgi:DNA polymerase I-like protein with 3'-5' exonuclease and polymerase domains